MFLYASLFLVFVYNDDPVTSYFGVMQFVTLLFFWSLILFKSYLEKKQCWKMIISVLLYALVLLSYEIGYPLLLTYPVIAYISLDKEKKLRVRESIKQAIPFMITAVFLFIIYYYLSAQASRNYGGTSFSLNAIEIVKTFIKQVFSSMSVLPHLYVAYYKTTLSTILRSIKTFDVVIGLLFFISFMKYIVPNLEKNLMPKQKHLLIWMGVLLIICPSLVIAVSSKYQALLIFGTGYLPMYISRFGFLILFYLLLQWLSKALKNIKVRKGFQIAIASLLTLSVIFGLQTNRDILKVKNVNSQIRLFVEQTIKDHILEGVTEHSQVLFESVWYRNYSEFNRRDLVSYWTGKKVVVPIVSEYAAEQYKKGVSKILFYDNEYESYYFQYKFKSISEGIALFGKLDTMLVGAKGNEGIMMDGLRVYSYGKLYDAIEVAVDEGNGFQIKRLPMTYQNGFYKVEIIGKVDMQSLVYCKQVQ